MLRKYVFLAGCLAIPLLTGSGTEHAAAAGAPVSQAKTTPDPAPGKFLVAARQLGDWHFNKTVIYLLKHDQQGTLGLIINKPGTLRLSNVVEGIDNAAASTHRLHYGGPVETTLVTMLIRGAGESPMIEPVTDNISFSVYREVMEQLLSEDKPASMLRFYIGHAGWMPGQLEKELQHGDWHLIDGDPREVFGSRNRNLWQRLIRKLEPEGLMAGSDTPLMISDHALAGRL